MCNQVIHFSDKYIDYDANIDTTYYYYLRSHNDFTESKETSDTVIINYQINQHYEHPVVKSYKLLLNLSSYFPDLM